MISKSEIMIIFAYMDELWRYRKKLKFYETKFYVQKKLKLINATSTVFVNITNANSKRLRKLNG